MSEDEQGKNPGIVEARIKEMNIKNGDSSDEDGYGTIYVGEPKKESPTDNGINSSYESGIRSASQSPMKPLKSSNSSIAGQDEHIEVVGAKVTIKLEPNQPPKLSRSSPQKILARPPPLFNDSPDKTEEAKTTFQVIPSCSYASKAMGSTEHAMDCDCTEEWDATTKVNNACGDDSDCINRATKMECVGDCGCGSECQNQRFQQKQYAQVTVIKTEKKGYGLRTNTALHPGDFIFEYIGEVINEVGFRRRMLQYDEEGIKHFYFMSLSKNEFVDATKKGNLGRFCNHSCNPNCYVDKWVVGDKLRMGIFAERNIKAGEELVFDYNVDRYGADPQPCYCDEPNCTGFLGGKTQTERATKLSNTTIEALGIEDGDGWDTTVAKKPRKKKLEENDEDYVNDIKSKTLDEDGVTKVMATLMQCKEKWIVVKLLHRIQQSQDEKVINRVVKMHGYQIMNTALSTWKEDVNVALQILDILNRFPRLTRNKISDSKIETTIESLQGCGDERVETRAAELLKVWSTLEVAYRIPRKKRDPMSSTDRRDRLERRESAREERKVDRSRSRSKSRSRSSSRSLDAPRGPSSIPSGPRNLPQRNAAFYQTARPRYQPPRPSNTLPPGWFTATSDSGTYYYSVNGETTWKRPTMPAAQPAPPPKPVPKTISNNKALEDIINGITNPKANKPNEKVPTSTAPQLTTDESQKDKKAGKEKWRALTEEKQKKLYENTLFPHINHVMSKYKNKLPRDDLKRFAKEIGKKLVDSDFKRHRVEDPTRISAHIEKKVKTHVKEYFDKAVAKKHDREKRKAQQKEMNGDVMKSPNTPAKAVVKQEEDSDDDDAMKISDDDEEEDVKIKQDSNTPITPMDQITNGDGLKRKRESEDGPNGRKLEDDDATPNKRPRSLTPPAPPPPPPPPVEDLPDEHEMADESPSLGEERSNSMAHLSNGHYAVDDGLPSIEGEEQMEDIDQRLPPPSPPFTDVMSGEKARILTLNAVPTRSLIETPNTPEAVDADMYDDQEEDSGHVKVAQMQQLEVNTSI